MRLKFYTKCITAIPAFLMLTLETFSQAPPVTTIGTASFAGGTYSVPITVTGFSNVGNISLSINYNPAELIYTGVTLNSGLSPASAITTPVTDQSGTFRLSYVSATAITLGSPSGTLITLTFTAKPGTEGARSLLTWSTLQGACDITPPSPGNFTPQITVANMAVYFKNGFIDIAGAGKTLNLQLHLEGLYDQPSGQMRQAQGISGNQFPGTTADQITVELHSAVAGQYNSVVYFAENVNLNTAGQATINIPSNYSGSYYITILHRNSLPTVSANPVSFSGTVVNYAFSTPAGMAYGNNQRNISGTYVIYGGEVVQDGLIDISDMIEVDNFSASAANGYLPADVNGDGLIDLTDMIIVDNNSSQTVSIRTP